MVIFKFMISLLNSRSNYVPLLPQT